MEYLNVGLSVSGFVDLPKNNIMQMWMNKNQRNRNTNNREIKNRNMHELKVMNECMFQSYDDYINGTGMKKKKKNGIEKFFVKADINKSVVNKESGIGKIKDNNKKKRKRKGGIFQYLTDNKGGDELPPIKRRKLNHNGNNIENKNKDIICDKCERVICNDNSLNKDKLIQLHMDEHIAEQLSREINNIQQIMPKEPK